MNIQRTLIVVAIIGFLTGLTGMALTNNHLPHGTVVGVIGWVVLLISVGVMYRYGVLPE